tara:strand:- start:4157 stop:4480 length:324 start_codon:yes stop_codon:yes gene_type:complete
MRFKTIQQLANYITKLDDTTEPGDELTIAEAMQVARIFCTNKYVYANGPSHLSVLYMVMEYAPDICINRPVALIKICTALENKYETGWFPYNLFRWRLSKIIKSYNL